MIDEFVRDLRVLQKADVLIGRIWLKFMVRRFGLFAFAGLIAVLGLAMTDVAGFFTLQAALGPVWAAALVAVGDFVVAAIVMLVGRKSQPRSEIDKAFEVRKMAIDSIQADARGLKVTIDTFGEEIREAKDTIAGFVQSPLDGALQKLLIPAIMCIIKALRGHGSSQADSA